MLTVLFIREPNLLNPDIINTFNGNPPAYVAVLDFTGLSSGLIYSVLNFFVFYRFKKENRRSNRFKTPIQWLNVLLIISLVLWIISWSAFLFRKEGVSERDISGAPYAILVAGYVLAMYAAAFFSQRYPTLFGSDESRRSRARENLGLDENQVNDYANKIIAFMKNEKPYLDENLNLDQMAKSLRLHRNTVSFLINEYFQKSFKDFINEYRLAHSLELLKSGDERTILNIAFDSGFSSKSAFNKIFKEKTGLTPGEYKQKSTG
jgi:AraC-like DNA-binding protein